MTESNFFDALNPIDMEEALKYQQDAKAVGERLDYLIHRVFAQTEEGVELLNIWKESLLLSSTAEAGDDMVSIGIREGMHRFIRGILLTIKRIEEDK